MKLFLVAATVAATVSLTTPVSAADINISIFMGQPDYYGRLDVGGYPSPRLLYAQPILIEHVQPRTPIYMRVPPGHAKHWDKHCHEYNACSERVYFVQDDWYSRDYVPRYQEQHRKTDGKHETVVANAMRATSRVTNTTIVGTINIGTINTIPVAIL